MSFTIFRRAKASALAVASAGLMLPCVSHAAGPVAVGTPITIDSATNSFTPNQLGAVAYGSDGSFLATWAKDPSNQGVTKIYVGRFAANGAALGAEIEVSDPTVASDNPAVAVDAQNNFVVVWREGRSAQSGGIMSPMMRLYSANGTPRGAAACVDTSCTSNANTVTLSVAMADGGDFAVLWSNPFTRLRRFAADGTAKSKTPVLPFGYIFSGSSSISMNRTSGDFAVAAASFAAIGTQTFATGANNILVQRYSAAGAKVGTKITAAHCSYYVYTPSGFESGCELTNSAVVLDDAGSFSIVYSYISTDSSIRVQRFSSAGIATGQALALETVAGSLLDSEALDLKSAASNGKGSIAVIWGNVAWGDVAQGTIQGRRYNADGTMDAAAFQVTQQGNGGPGYTVPSAMDPNGNFIVLWGETAGNYPNQTETILGQRYSP